VNVNIRGTAVRNKVPEAKRGVIYSYGGQVIKTEQLSHGWSFREKVLHMLS